MDWETSRQKKLAVRDAEAAGSVADSMDVRREIMARIHSGAITLAQGQYKLKKIQASAGRSGKVTRAAAFRAG